MTPDVRIPSEADRDDIALVLSTSLNFPLASAMARNETFVFLDVADPAVEALSAMFSSPDPWCPFFF